MLISTIIPTIGRPSLSRAVESVLNQERGDFQSEIIVVNDSGRDLPYCDWQDLPQVKLIHTNKRNRSVARNAGAAIARGEYLHFLDDDDWVAENAFRILEHRAKNSRAAWIYGGFSLVDNDGRAIIDIKPKESGNCCIQLMAWEWIPLQASWIQTDAFFTVGGFTSLYDLHGGFEDVHLSRTIACQFDFARSEEIVAVIRSGDVGSTTNYQDMFIQNRYSRELILEQPGVFNRLLQSARQAQGQSAYWCGKVAYYYLASVKWAIKRRRIFTALSRSYFGLLANLRSGTKLLQKEFWKGVFRPHYPRMGIALQEANADYLYAETRRKIQEKGF